MVLVGVGAAIKLVAPGLLEGLGWTPLLVALAGVPGALAALFLQSVLLGEGRMVAYNAVEVSQAALTLVALLVGFGLADIELTGTLAVLGAGRCAAAIAFAVLLSRRSGIAARPDAALARSMLDYGFRVYVAILVSFLVIRLDLLLVNAYSGQTEAGLYSVAATLADGMFVLPMVIGLNLFARGCPGRPGRGERRGLPVGSRAVRPDLPRHRPDRAVRDQRVLRQRLRGLDLPLLLAASPGSIASGC